MNYTLTVTGEHTTAFPPHRHDTWELMCYIRGKGVLATEEGDYPFSENTVFAVPPHFTHGSRAESEFINICLHAPLTVPEKRLYRVADGEALRPLFEAVRRIDGEYPENRDALSHLIWALGDLIVSVDPAEKTPERALYRLICEHFTEPNFSVSDAVLTLYGSKDHIRRRFLKRYGMTPNEFCTVRRIEYAKTLMTIYGKSMKNYEIAAACGFEDPLYFSRKFKEKTAQSPNLFKKNIQKETSHEEN